MKPEQLLIEQSLEEEKKQGSPINHLQEAIRLPNFSQIFDQQMNMNEKNGGGGEGYASPSNFLS